MFRLFAMASAVSVWFTTAASAQVLDPELTMRPITNAAVELPAPVTELLALPDVAASIAAERSADGLERANENRARAGENRARGLARAGERSAIGLGIAADARERGAELGAEIAESARGLRESLVRGDGRIDLPFPVDLPQLPDHVPSRPELPARPVERPDLTPQAEL